MTSKVAEIGPFKNTIELMKLKTQETIESFSEHSYVGKYVMLGKCMEAIQNDSIILSYITRVINSTNEPVTQETIDNLIHTYVSTWVDTKYASQ